MLGEIELSLDTTLDDLKTRVLTLPSLGKVSLPTTECLRVRMKEGEKLTRILKDGSLTLRFVILNICLLVLLNPVSPYLVYYCLVLFDLVLSYVIRSGLYGGIKCSFDRIIFWTIF